MSRIIKPHEQHEVSAFDFREIERSSLPFRAMDHAQAAGGTEEESPLDPLVEVEQTVKKRLLEAERRAQEIERVAYEKGYAQGQKDGVEYGRKSMQIVKERVEEIILGLDALPDKVFKDYREWFLDTCLTVARRIVRIELASRPEALTQLIDSLLGEAEASQSLTLYLHPADLEMIKKHTDFLASLERSDRRLALKPDTQLEKGGCRVESEIQLLDASIEAQFALVKEALFHHGPNN